MRPAMLVLGLAVLILGSFVVLGIVTSRSSAPVPHSSTATAVPGSSLRAVPAAGLLSPIVAGGDPPANVLDAVSVPSGSVRLSHRDNSGGSAQFDAQVQFRSDASQAALLDFFAADMKLQGWQVFSRGPASNAPATLEVLGKLAGSDGYYWEMGAIVPPTTFGAGGPAHGQTDFSVRLFRIGDAQ